MGDCPSALFYSAMGFPRCVCYFGDVITYSYESHCRVNTCKYADMS